MRTQSIWNATKDKNEAFAQFRAEEIKGAEVHKELGQKVFDDYMEYIYQLNKYVV